MNYNYSPINSIMTLFYILISFIHHFIILRIIIFTKCSENSVPEQKIQSIITGEVLVMLVVVNGSIHPFANPGAVEVFGIELPA